MIFEIVEYKWYEKCKQCVFLQTGRNEHNFVLQTLHREMSCWVHGCPRYFSLE